jgi:di/tricarboxylate transporter
MNIDFWMMLAQLPQFHMWVVFGFVVLAVVLFASSRISLEISSIILLGLLMLFFELLPVRDEAGEISFQTSDLLLGFANPALIAVLGLLVLGQAVIRTGSLTWLSNLFMGIKFGGKLLPVFLILLTVTLISNVLNNTPACVIFIPIMMAVAKHLQIPSSKVMIPLSYAAILGGITTLIGSSTNLLVSGVLEDMGREPLGFFDFTLPGLAIVGVGLLYLVFILPKLLPNRADIAGEVMTGGDRTFVAQLELSPEADAVGKTIQETGLFEDKDLAVKLIQRGEHAFLPPFDENLTLKIGDVLILTTTREALSNLFANTPKQAFKKIHQMSIMSEEKEGDVQMTELLIAPASRMIGRNIEQIGFHHKLGCIVLGIQRRSRIITSRMTEMRLAAGDVLLIMGSRQEVSNLRQNKDVILMEWTTQDLPSKRLAWRVNVIFACVVALSAFNILPIHLAAFLGAGAAILSGCLNLRQALRSLDSAIIFLVAAGIALSMALQKTGGAAYLADSLVSSMEGFPPLAIMSAMFLLMGVLTNILSNNATALLFTPIAVSTAATLNVPPEMFIFAVIFASNCCSFASPIGYQTNLLVMAPGHYQFSDYLKAGIPLVILVWATYTAYAYFFML